MIVFTFCSDCILGDGREGSSKVGRRLQVDDPPAHMEALQRVFVGTCIFTVTVSMFHMHTHAGTSWRLQWGYVSKQTESVD